MKINMHISNEDTLRGVGASSASRIRGRGRRTVRPSGAYKLLVILMYGSFSYVELVPSSGYVRIKHIAKLARVLGTESKKVRGWLAYLESVSYIESLVLSENHRQAQFRIRRPRIVT